MRLRKTMLPLLSGVALAAPVMIGGTALAQDIPLSYERLSSMEEPFVAELGDVTLVLNGVLDGAFVHDTESSTDARFTGNVEISAHAQLANRWRVGAQYFGQYSTMDDFNGRVGDTYSDNAALTAGSVWGTLAAGNVSGVVREQTRRLRGIGNGALAFDGFLGAIGDVGAAYSGRFGPWVISGAIDPEGRFDLGAMSQRPHGTRDLRLSFRAISGDYTDADGSRGFHTAGAGVVGELIYGSSAFDLGTGYERFATSGPNAGRWYVSAGARTKTGMLSLSLEGHYGRIGDAEEVSAALGARYDVARGLSANLGVNHASAEATTGGVRITDTEETKTVVSMRYSF